jgi:hypothetical protein
MLGISSTPAQVSSTRGSIISAEQMMREVPESMAALRPVVSCFPLGPVAEVRCAARDRLAVMSVDPKVAGASIVNMVSSRTKPLHRNTSPLSIYYLIVRSNSAFFALSDGLWSSSCVGGDAERMVKHGVNFPVFVIAFIAGAIGPRLTP